MDHVTRGGETKNYVHLYGIVEGKKPSNKSAKHSIDCILGNISY